MKKETWLPIKGYEGFYEISDHGNVKSLARTVNNNGGVKFLKEKLLKKVKSADYPAVNLMKFNSSWNVRIHRLVGTHFIPNPEKKPFINHIDGTRTNNHVSNLEWCTQKENMQHASKYGLLKIHHGSDVVNSKLKDEQVRAIRASKIGSTQLGKIYNVSRRTISDIRSNRVWKHLL